MAVACDAPRMNPRELEKRIEELIREHMAACRVAVEAAVERAFAAASSEPVRQPRKAALPSKRTPKTPKRTPEELQALRKQLYSAVCAKPGETMVVLAAQLGTTPRLLRVPVARLKREGRVVSVGQRPHTRYFPMVGGAKSDKEVAA